MVHLLTMLGRGNPLRACGALILVGGRSPDISLGVVPEVVVFSTAVLWNTSVV